MAHEKQFGAGHPGCIIFLLDQSSSMAKPMPTNRPGAGKPKAASLATIVNKALNEIVNHCYKGAAMSPRCDIALIGYRGSSVESMWPEALKGEELISVTDVASNPLQVERRETEEVDEVGEIRKRSVDFRVWIEQKADGETPMCRALKKASELGRQWASTHAHCFPPLVIHVTDGESTDGDPRAEARLLREVSTEDGNLLLFNCHISSESDEEVLYPATEDELPKEEFAPVLFEMSSLVPETMYALGRKNEIPLKVGSRGFVFNADIADLTRMINFATVSMVAR